MIHVHDQIDPLFDIEVINFELEQGGLKTDIVCFEYFSYYSPLPSGTPERFEKTGDFFSKLPGHT